MLFSLLALRRGEPQPLQSGTPTQSDANLTPPGPVEEEELDEEEGVVGDMYEVRFDEEGEGFKLFFVTSTATTLTNDGASLRYPIYCRYLLILLRFVSWVEEGRETVLNKSQEGRGSSWRGRLSLLEQKRGVS